MTSQSNSSESTTQATVNCSHRLVIVSLFAWLATFVIATCHPVGKPADEVMTSLSFGATYSWVASQTIVLILPGLLLGGVIGRILPRTGLWVGFVLLVSVPLVMFCDATTFTWVAERFLSDTTRRIFTTLLPSLVLYLTWSMVVESVVAIAAIALGLFIVWHAANRIGRRWKSREQSVTPFQAIALMSVIAVLLSLPTWTKHKTVLDQMADSSTRHPFCAFRIVGFHGVGVPAPFGERKTIDRLRGLQAIEAVHERDAEQAALTVTTKVVADQAAAPKKVILVVIECLRPEIIEPDVMPNLSEFAERSIVCRRNFSGGNATCYGVFSLVTGLEAIWFRRPVKEKPIMNRLLHDAGYKLAFYGGGGSQNDWKHFNMEGFIAPQHYDQFQLEPAELPHSDIRTVNRANQFVDGLDDANDAGRMAIAYIFATHRRFSEPQDRVFEPAATEDSMLRTSDAKELFYNRYKNSARTVDRLIKPLLRDDCVVVVTGDHGEPIMDDGTSGHGTRLSRYQNLTPALIYYPGVKPRTIDVPTCHADFLPTLLSILGFTPSDPNAIDGQDLLGTDHEALASRSFLSRNYIDQTSLLVGPWTFDPSQPFGYRVLYGISQWQSSYLNPIDERGLECQEAKGNSGKKRFDAWIENRFGAGAIDESRSARELFTEFFQSHDRETRFSALKIAEGVAEVEDYLYEQIAESTRDPDAEIREYAKDLIIKVNRRSAD